MVTTQNSHFIQSCKVTSLQQLFCLVLTNKRNKRKNTSKTVLVAVGHKAQYNYNTTNHSTIKTIKTQNTIYQTKCDRHKHNCAITKLRQIKVKITCWVIVKSSTSSKIHWKSKAYARIHVLPTTTFKNLLDLFYLINLKPSRSLPICKVWLQLNLFSWR